MHPDRDGYQKYYDELTHLELPSDLVQAARSEEMKYFAENQIWDIVPVQEAWSVTGKAPISTRWIDVNKGDQDCYDIRSPLVAREIGDGRYCRWG